jgi:hypothetical protein
LQILLVAGFRSLQCIKEVQSCSNLETVENFNQRLACVQSGVYCTYPIADNLHHVTLVIMDILETPLRSLVCHKQKSLNAD